MVLVVFLCQEQYLKWLDLLCQEQNLSEYILCQSMYSVTYSGQLLSKAEALCQEGFLGCEASVRCKAACSFLVKSKVPYIVEDPTRLTRLTRLFLILLFR